MRTNHPAGIKQQVDLTGVPFFPQNDFQCGPAALATSLAYFGAPVNAQSLVPEVYLPERHGSLQIEMLAATRRHGLIAYQLAPKMPDVLREIDAGTPVILLQDFGLWPVTIWHYAVAVGYDLDGGNFIFRSGIKQHLEMPFAVAEFSWKESKYWAMVTVPPDKIPVTATEAPYLKAVVAFEHAGNKEGAHTAYAAMLARWPDSLPIGVALANSEYGLGNLKQAEAVLRSMIEKHPDAAVAYNNLAQTLADEGRPAEALPLAEKAVALGGPYLKNAQDTLDGIRGQVSGAGPPAAIKTN
jgi:tetratricopeptide (TPR) repeat protein